MKDPARPTGLRNLISFYIHLLSFSIKLKTGHNGGRFRYLLRKDIHLRSRLHWKVERPDVILVSSLPCTQTLFGFPAANRITLMLKILTQDDEQNRVLHDECNYLFMIKFSKRFTSKIPARLMFC
jgi:hypothetical protein